MKNLIETLTNYIAACFSGLWIETFEPDEAIREIESLCREQSWNMTVWDISQGDPLSAVTSAEGLGNGETPQLVVLRNFHRFLGSIEIVQSMERQIQSGKVSRIFLIVLAPVVQIPVELEKSFVVVEHPLHEQKCRQQVFDLAAAYLREIDIEAEKPLAVEKRYETQLIDPLTGEDLGLPLVGIIDLLFETENGLALVDFKTAASASSNCQIQHEIQLSAYAYLVRQLPDREESALEIRQLGFAAYRNRRPRRSAKRFDKNINPMEEFTLNKYDINDVFVATALGAGVVSSIMTGSIVVGMFVVLGVSAACVYTGAIRF